MEEQTKELKVPAAIYERAEAIAGETGLYCRSLCCLDGLAMLFSPCSD